MKIFSTLFLSIFCFSLIACSSSTSEPATDDTTIAATKVSTAVSANKKRPQAPTTKSITRYKTSPTDGEGTLLSKEVFNEKGQKTEFISYDYYGSGEEDGRTTFKYDAAGNKIQSYDGTTTETWEYDDQKRIVKAKWTRENGQGASEERFYDEKGNETEVKYYTADGKYDFSRTTIYTYDEQGQVIRETKWEKYTDGSADMQMYDVGYEYSPEGKKLKKINYREDGVVTDYEELRYDGAGNQIEIIAYNGAGELDTREVFEVNEYGETVKDQTFSGESLQYTNTYEYNDYGKMVNMMYTHEDGDAWGERTVIEYHQ